MLSNRIKCYVSGTIVCLSINLFPERLFSDFWTNTSTPKKAADRSESAWKQRGSLVGSRRLSSLQVYNIINTKSSIA